MTYDSPTWDQPSSRFQSGEKSMMDHAGNIITKENKGRYILSNCALDYNYDLPMHIPSIGTAGIGGRVSAAQLAQQ